MGFCERDPKYALENRMNYMTLKDEEANAAGKKSASPVYDPWRRHGNKGEALFLYLQELVRRRIKWFYSYAHHSEANSNKQYSELMYASYFQPFQHVEKSKAWRACHASLCLLIYINDIDLMIGWLKMASPDINTRRDRTFLCFFKAQGFTVDEDVL